jgi:phosphopantothenoylcysteine decarboxylase/phosphopantothenate--cysteine ligase
VTLVSGPTALPSPLAVRRVSVLTAEEMLRACEAALPVDAAVLVARVADWRPELWRTSKMKKGSGPPEIRLVENPDILARLSQPARAAAAGGGLRRRDRRHRGQRRAKLERKGCDWILANNVGEPGVLGGEENTVTLISREGAERWPRATKSDVADKLARRIAEALRP